MKKKLLISASLIALAGSAVAVSGYAVLPIANQLVRQNGFPEARVSGLALTPSGIMIEHIDLDGNDFTSIDQINIVFNWTDFLSSGTIEEITVKNIAVTAELDETNQLKIAGWDATLPESSSGSAFIPVRSLVLQGMTLDVATEEGDIRLEGKLSVETPNTSEQTLNYALWGQQQQLSLDAKGRGTLKENGDISLSTTLNDGRLNLPQIELSRASGWIDYHYSESLPAPTFSGQLVAGKVNTMGALLQNVTATIDTSKAESLFFKTSPAGHENVTLSGRWLSQDSQDLIELTVASKSALEFLQIVAAEQSEDLAPWVKTANPLLLTLSAPIADLKANDKSADFLLQLGDTHSDTRLSAKGKAVYQADGAFRIDARSTLLNIADGTVDVAPFLFDSKTISKDPLKTSLTLRSINMDKLSNLAEIDGLKAEGLLNGTIPLSYTDKGLTFGEGQVKSEGSGVFAYTPDSYPPSLQGDDERMETVRQALGNFHFTNLSVELSGPFTGKMKTTLKAEGTNPIFGDRPIQLNLNLDGDLGPVIQQTLQAGDIGGKIRSQLSGAKK